MKPINHQLKIYLLVASAMVFSSQCFCQTVIIKTDKVNYDFEEVVKLHFEVDAKIDSIQQLDLTGFKILIGPNKSLSTSLLNGVSSIKESRSYNLRPMKAGEFVIDSPIFYCNGKAIQGNSIRVNIKPSKLSPKEQETQLLKDFQMTSVKPFGTTRVTFFDNMGYIESYIGNEWKVVRVLTATEIEQLNALK